MRVSVVLPVRNGGAFLSLAVASIVSQSWRDLELLVIDDGSDDGAVDALAADHPGETRLRTLSNPGRGLVAALNFGLREARGELIARMDADDVALPDRLALQVHFLDAHPGVAVVGAQVAVIDANGALTGERTHFPTDPAALAAALMARGCVVKHPSVVARKDALLGAGGYRPAFALAEDYDLWLRLAERTRLANLPDVLLHYRGHVGQLSAGVNLEQRFVRDLALIAARMRRAGEADPFNGAADALRFDRPIASGAPAPIARLASAYRAVSFLEGASPEPPAAAALSNLIEAAQGGLLGDGRRYRALALARCARLAARRSQWSPAVAAAVLALRISPGRAAPWLAGVGVRGGDARAPKQDFRVTHE
jgi:GT2 family glycosyltransferase